MPQTPPETGPIEGEIRQRLSNAFAPETLVVSNDSEMHSGHAGDDGSGESHFSVIIRSDAFEGVSRLQRQRMVLAALGDIPGQRVHAFAIKALSPTEPLPERA